MSAEFNPHPVLPHDPTPASDDSQGILDFDTFLRMTVAQGVSDIHLRVGRPPMLRRDGEMMTTKFPPLSSVEMEGFIRRIVPENIAHRLSGKLDFDFGFELPGLARFRVNLLYEMNQTGLVLRVIPTRIPEIDTLGVPLVIKKFAQMHKGLVLMTGPTGSGKTTTLASLLNYINQNWSKHLITLEDPVEYVYHNDKSVITQRQIGMDTESFPHGIKFALRQDPDVILIGELRDRETMTSALVAAETGHLVFATLHTIDAVQTINRVIDIFEPHEREHIRHQLANVLQGTMTQRLIRKAEGKGRVPVSEIMMVTPAVRDYILRGEIDEIYQLMNHGDYEGMSSLNQSLYRAYRNNLITAEDALNASENPAELQQMIRGAYHGTGESGSRI